MTHYMLKMNAEEARELSIQGLENTRKRLRDELFSKIREACEDGEQRILYYIPLHETLRDELFQNGFTLTQHYPGLGHAHLEIQW